MRGEEGEAMGGEKEFEERREKGEVTEEGEGEEGRD